MSSEAVPQALVTGATGFVGSRLLRWLTTDGMKVQALDRGDAYSSAELRREGIEWWQCDLADPDAANYRHHRRDFTYIDDIVEDVIRTLDRPAEPNLDWSGANPDSASSQAPYRLYNIGAHSPMELMLYREVLEENLVKKAKKNLLPMQPGDVPDTYADVTDLKADVGYEPATTVEKGVIEFEKWYRDFYQV